MHHTTTNDFVLKTHQKSVVLVLVPVLMPVVVTVIVKFLTYTYMPIADFPDFDWLAGASSVFLAPQAPDSTCNRVLWRRRRASVRVPCTLAPQARQFSTV